MLKADISVSKKRQTSQDSSLEQSQEYDFNKFNNSDNDSDFADKKVLDAVKENFNDEGQQAKKPEGPI